MLSSMAVLSFLGDLHYSTNKLAVRVTVLTKWSTITTTMFRKTAMVLGDQKVRKVGQYILQFYILSYCVQCIVISLWY